MQQIANFTLGLCAALFLSACGGGLSKGMLAGLIEEQYKNGKQLCWKLENMDGATLPIRVRNRWGEEPRKHPILAGLAKGDFIMLEDIPGAFGMTEGTSIQLTEKGTNANVWNPQAGFCVGRKGIDDVLEWTEPGNASSTQKTKITYTWKIVDRPRWATDEFFGGIPGMTKPEKDYAVAVKTSNGWRISDDIGDFVLP